MLYFLDPQHLKARRRRPRKGYRHAHPRTLRTQCRRYEAVNYLRTRYRLSINRLAQIIGGSTRTIHEDVKAAVAPLRRLRRWERRSKNSRGIVNSKGGLLTWKSLSRRVRDYLHGILNTIYEATGDEPP